MADHKNHTKEDGITPDKAGNSSIGRLLCLIAVPVALICFFLPWIGIPSIGALSGYDLAQGFSIPLVGIIGWPILFIIPISMLAVLIVLLSKKHGLLKGSRTPIFLLVAGTVSVPIMLYHFFSFNSEINQRLFGAIGVRRLIPIYASAFVTLFAFVLVTTGGILDLCFRDNDGGGRVYDTLGDWVEAFKNSPPGKFISSASPFANVVKLLFIVGVLLALDQVSRGGVISPYIGRILMLSGIAITLAVSLNLINGFTGQFSIGHAGFMAVGAYTSAYFSVNYGIRLAATLGDGTLGWVVALTLATLIGALCAGVAGLVVGVPSLRLKGDYLAIVTLGFGQIIVVLLNNIDAIGGARGYSGIPIVKSFFWIFLIAVLTILIVYNIVHSAFGRALISIREDEIAAEAMGVNTTRYKVSAFVISSAMAGAGGVLLAHFDGYLNPKSFEFIKSFEILIMIILGGLGSIVGSVLGAILLTVLPEALRGFAQYRMVIYSLLLIILMITRPQGLLGKTDAFKGLRARLRGLGGARTPDAKQSAAEQKKALSESHADSSGDKGEV